MILIAVVDDSNGMMFHNRRQSKDSVLRERILSLVKDKKLWINSYTAGQFLDCRGETIRVDEDFLDKAESGEYCFVENVSVSSREKSIEKIILFRWNRRYPSDFWFDFALKEPEWRRIEINEFSGSSHERITEEVYVRG